MILKVKRLHMDAKIPHYANSDDAGMDLYALEEVVIAPSQRVVVPTGIAIAIPSGFVGLIWDKSGIAAKGGLKTMGGVIDSGYRGEVGVIVHNLSESVYIIDAGKKVAQMLIQSVHQKEIVEVENLDETDRGEGGFGSTGLD